MATRFIILFIILLVIDAYVFRNLKKQVVKIKKKIRITIYLFYWLIPFLLIGFSILAFLSNGHDNIRSNKIMQIIIASFILFYIPKILIFLFQAVEDISKIIAWATKKMSKPKSRVYSGAEKISRSVFIGRAGLLLASIPFASILYGITKGRFNFRVNSKSLEFDHLPEEFDGFKIVQFSDFHAGSLLGQQETFKEAIELMNLQKADIIVFTGDIVNSKTSELDGWLDILSSLKAKHGKFSILGNHDYGDYYHWGNAKEKEENMELMKEYHKKMGFKLLLNNSHTFENNGEQIALLGVENWGEKPFPQYGDLDLAMENVKDVPFKILLSHDPTHWENKVLNKTDIALTLSGHTHGMQMAINIGDYSWSPASFKYPRWKGLYTENNQHLYINIGLGYIAFPGRVGTDPEITVIELKKKHVG